MAKFNIKTVKPKFVVTTAPETKIDVSINRPIITAKNQKAYFKLKNTGGPKGEKGDPGTAATIAVGSTSTGTPGTNASVTNSGTSSAAVLNFTIPRGDKGDKGDTGATGSPGAAATVTVGTTTTGQPGTSASVVNAGTQSAAVLNFTIPKGAKGDTGATGATGATGSPGAAATVSVGTTTTGQPGTNASVTNSGTQSAAVLNFTIPKGAKGDNGNPGSAATVAVGTVTTGLPGTSATVTNVGTSSAAVFDFTIPRGDKGEAGSGSGDMLASDYDPNGTVANAGGIVAYVASEIPPLYTELGENTDGPITQKASREALYVDSGKTVVKLGTKAFSTDTYGARSTSVGAGTRAGGDNSVAVGDSSSAMGSYAIAVGSGATTGAGTNSISIGHNARTNSGTIYSNSVALGASATATRDYEVNVGTGTAAGFGGNNDHTRVIAGVHAGVLNTDAVNVGQLNAAIPTKTSELTNDGSDNTSTYVEADELAAVATSGNYSDLSGAPAIPTVNDATLTINQNGVQAGTFTANASSNATISLTDTTYSTMTGATSGADGASGLVPKPSAGDQDKVLSGAGTWVSQPEMVVLSYGHSTWTEFTAAYTDNRVVFCRASTDADPGTGDQTRLAPLVYVDSESSPTSVQFHFHRSLATHTDAQQGDQILVYTLDSANGGTWSVATREASTRVVAGTNMTSWYNNGVLTLYSAQPAPVDHTSSVTPGTNVTIDAGGKVISIGKIVIVNMNIVTSATVYAYSTLLSSIPMRNPDNFLWLSMVDANNANKMYRAYYQSGSGEIRTRDQLPAGTYGLSFVYVTS